MADLQRFGYLQMTNDSGKKPLNIDNLKDVIREWKFAWMDIKGTDERDRENYRRRAFGVDANMMHNLATRIESAFTTCPNCERLEGKLEAAHHWFDVTTKSNGNLIEENKRLQAQLESAKQLLLEHGRHEFACPACYDDIVPLDCICGFSDRLSKLDGAE